MITKSSDNLILLHIFLIFVLLILHFVAKMFGFPLSPIIFSFVVFGFYSRWLRKMNFIVFLIGLVWIFICDFLLWIFIVSHGHFFECPLCWLSSSSSVSIYIPRIIRGIVYDFLITFALFMFQRYIFGFFLKRK